MLPTLSLLLLLTPRTDLVVADSAVSVWVLHQHTTHVLAKLKSISLHNIRLQPKAVSTGLAHCNGLGVALVLQSRHATHANMKEGCMLGG